MAERSDPRKGTRRWRRFEDLSPQERRARLERMQGITWALIVFSVVVVYLSIALPIVLR